MSFSSVLARWFSNYDSRESMGSRLRARRIAPMKEMIEAVYREHGRVEMVDLGGAENYWNIVSADFLDNHKVEITIVNIPGADLPEAHGRFKFVEADCCNLTCFADNSFQIAHSNSVIEHVGDWQRMTNFATEIARVSDKYYVQTPNYWFPIEPHFMAPFFQWLPEPARVWLVLHFQLGHRSRATNLDEAVRSVESVRLLNRKMVKALFADGEVITEWFFGLPKSFIAIKR